MSLSTVKCFNDETENWENVPMLVWVSDICFGFFNSVFPPYEIARRFCSDPDFALDVQLGNYFIEWEPFELSKEDYNEIKEYCMTKFKCHYFELETNINSSRDYIMWRIEKKHGVPIQIQKEFYKRYDAADRKFKLLQDNPDDYLSADYLSAWNDLNEIIKEKQSVFKSYKIKSYKK